MENKEKLEAVNADLKALEKKHDVKIIAQLMYDQSGIVPGLGMIDLSKEKPEEVEAEVVEN